MRLQEETAVNITLACAFLNNLAVDFDMPDVGDDADVDDEVGHNANVNPNDFVEDYLENDGRAARENIALQFFS